jgi:hypothetical protein
VFTYSCFQQAGVIKFDHILEVAMITVKDYEDTLRDLGGNYLIHGIEFVPDLTLWAQQNGEDLSEPHQPAKLISKLQDNLTMIMQSEISEEMLNDVIKNLSLRWSLKDNTFDMDKKINSLKKRLVFCYLKERARSMKDIGGDDLVEDEWVMNEMERLGFFNE